MAVIPCPKCDADLLFDGEMTHVGWVHPEHDPELKARADLVLECEGCGAVLNAFVPFDQFQLIEEAA